MSSSFPGRLLAAVFIAGVSAPAAVAADSDAASALDRALADSSTRSASPSQPLAQIGGGGAPTLKLADISLDVLTAAGASTATDDEIASLQGGDHDPNKRGFTLQQAEVSLFGAVDPYFQAEAHIVFKEDGVELEEAYGTTTQLPDGLQVKAGFYLTEFGRTNPQHPHQWPWLDQPVVNSRIFGPNGTRAVGARLAWLAPLPWFSEFYFSMQGADNATEVSFLGGEAEVGEPETTPGGRPAVERSTRSLADFLYSARWVNNWELNQQTMFQIGLSGAAGPNKSGTDGHTEIVGTDLLLKWRHATKTYLTLAWQTEFIERFFHADDGVDPDLTTAIAADELSDYGVCSQILIGFYPRWAAGFRVDYATGHGDSYEIGSGAIARDQDPFRDNRLRLSPLVTFNPSEFSKFRLQYDYDRADHLPGDEAHSVWLGLELMIGAHPAHNY